MTLVNMRENRLDHRGTQRGKKPQGFSYLAGLSGGKHFLKFGKESLLVLPSLRPSLASCGAIHGATTWAQTAERTGVKGTHRCTSHPRPHLPSLATQRLAAQGVTKRHHEGEWTFPGCPALPCQSGD